MRKLYVVLVVFALVLAACGSSGSKPDPSNPSTSGAGVWDSRNWDEATWQ